VDDSQAAEEVAASVLAPAPALELELLAAHGDTPSLQR
jgi:hypothetical protein